MEAPGDGAAHQGQLSLPGRVHQPDGGHHGAAHAVQAAGDRDWVRHDPHRGAGLPVLHRVEGQAR